MDDILIKVIVIGDSLVGKTSLIHRYVNNMFRADYKSTIGVDFSLKVITWANCAKVKLQLWDIAGQERFTFMTRNYYRDAKGCLLLFDVTNLGSFEKVKRWKKDLDSKARQPDGSLIPCLLVGNKCDLTQREVSAQHMTELCENMNFVGWTETSAKDGLMVKESMSFLIDIIMAKQPFNNKDFADSIQLRHRKTPEEHKCQC